MKKITMIGTDSSHCFAFAKLLRDTENEWTIRYAVRDTRSRLDLSVNRRAKIEEEMINDLEIKILDELSYTLIQDTDAFIIASVDARLHKEQFEMLSQIGKPVFIDKPLTYSCESSQAIENLSKNTGTPFFSSSSLRFSNSVIKCADFVKTSSTERWQVNLSGPLTFQKGIPGFYWYGIHLIEALLTIFPQNFQVGDISISEKDELIEISLFSSKCECLIRGNLNGKGNFQGNIFSKAGSVSFNTSKDEKPLYQYLVEKIVSFFETKKPPIDFSEILKVLELVETLNGRLKNDIKKR